MNRRRKDRSGRNSDSKSDSGKRHFGKRNWKKNDSGNRSGGNQNNNHSGKPRKQKFDRNKRPPKGLGRSRGRGGNNKRKSRNNH